MRLIDADAVKLPKGFFEKVDNVPKFYDWLNSLPVIDAVPVVRCKHCRYRDETWRNVSVRWLPCMDMRTDSNWYCGSAERRTDEAD